MRLRKRLCLAMLALATLTTLGCPPPSSPTGAYGGPGGGFTPPMPAAPGAQIGVNVGGAQDIGHFRALVEAGEVPRDEGLVVGGLYAEHDLPVAEAPAGKTLHLALGLALAPLPPDGKRSTLVQVGLGSGLSAEALRRPDLDLVVVADRSGSMQEDDRIGALRTALGRLVGKLGERDRLGVVAFDDVAETFHPLSRVTDRAALNAVIERIVIRNGTNIEAGLKMGYAMLSEVPAEPGRERRVLLITDAQPNVGATDENSFERLVSRHAEAGIGLTALGVGLDFGAALTDVIAGQRGGNYAFLQNAERLQEIFDQDFDPMVSPAAYDLTMNVVPAKGFRLAEVYGTRHVSATNGGYELKVKTLFFSRNRGAIVLRLEPETADAALADGQAIAEGTLAYTERDRVTQRSDRIEAALAVGAAPMADGRFYAPSAMRKTAAVTHLALALKEAVKRYHAGQVEAAIMGLNATRKELVDAGQALGNGDLAGEIALVDKLSENMVRRSTVRS